jgi:hypothetical protein
MFVSEIFSEAAEILGTTDESRVFRKLTQAVQALMESGHWFHTTREVDVCTGWDGFTVTLPKDIEVPLAINMDGSPSYFRGKLFQYHVNQGGRFESVNWAWDDRGFVATQMDIRQPAQVIAVAESDADVGATLRLVGTNQWNRDLRSQTADGTGVDGIIIPVHSLSDFTRGTIIPDGNTIVTREVAVTPITKFESTTPHQLASGQGMILSTVTGTTPTGITDSNQYYVGVVNPTTIQLYSDPLYAKSGTYPIALSNITDAGTLRLTDQRTANLVTSIELSSPPTISLSVGNPVTFEGAILPSPLVEGVTYYINSLDSTNFQVFLSLSDAQTQTRPIYLTGTSLTFSMYIRKPIAPITKLTFSVPHYYSTGDLVQASTNGGTLPEPLVLSQNYYVYVIDDLTVTLHVSNSDALSGINPIVLTTAGTGQNSLAKLIPATVAIGTTSNVLATGVGLSPATGSGATVRANLTGPVTNITVTAGGSSYGSVPLVTFDSTGGTGYVSTPSVQLVGSTGVGAVFTANIAGGKITSFTRVSGGSGYTFAPTVVISNGGGYGAAAHAVVVAGAVDSIVLDPVGSGVTAHALINSITNVVTNIIIDDPGQGYQFPPRVTISGGGGAGATATSTLTTSFIESYTVLTRGSGYLYPPAVSIVGGGGTGAAATAVVQGGEVVSISVISEGTGYSAAPSVNLVSSTGAFVQFTSTGTLPTPLVQGTTYRADAPLSANGFTVVNADFSPVNITSLGAGTLYVVISRTFGVTFTNDWTGDFSATPTGTAIYFGTDYLLPVTSPPIDSSTEFWLRRLTNDTAQVFDTEAHANGTGATGKVIITQFGTGQSYYAIKQTAQAVPYNNQLAVSNIQYLSDGQRVKVSTTGTLPAPLEDDIEYTIKIVDSNIELYENNLLVDYTTLGVGELKINIVRDFTVVPATTLTLNNAFYNTGTEVIARASENDVLPTPLLPDTSYFVRFFDNNEIELYDTFAHASGTGTTGRISYTKTGNSLESSFFVDAIEDITLVKAIYHVEKPVTQGYVSLYAYDYGRSNDMTLIGQYHPTEVNPKYRRVRLGSACSWARIIYRVKAPKITSMFDYIPVEQERALIAAVHAVDLEDKDFMDQATKYWAMALNYLKNQQNSMDGHAFVPPQINNITYGDGTDPVMF